MANRLTNATSPYLQQHAGNPVDWWEWGPEAFEEARRRDAPILLSVGYAACHWCHVMAHESFEDPEIAQYVNERFVAIKVDREERPDVDATYMTALQAMTGQGGWPMTVFLTPQGKPFYAGTYYPPRPARGMPGFRQVLEAVAQAWTQRRDEVDDAATNIAASLSRTGVNASGGAPTTQDLDAAVTALAGEFDSTAGGFGQAPKFPPSMVLEFLLRSHQRTGDPRALAMADLTFEQMARGGLYDQLGGGFARYSVDRHWVVPHFEKMLYDNALLLRGYTHWWRTTGSPLAQRVARETAQFLLSELRTAEGGFASSLDADSAPQPGEPPAEGAFYVWTPKQLREALDADDAAWAMQTFCVSDEGTFEHGASTLRLLRDPADPARWEAVRSRLSAARRERPRPGRDDKVVAAWNGLTIAALAEAGALFDEPAWVDAAVTCASLLLTTHGGVLERPDDRTGWRTWDGRLRRVSLGGEAGEPAGVLEDYGCVAEGLLTLVAVTGDPAWLWAAERLLHVVLTSFADSDGGFFDTATDATDPRVAAVRRPRDPTDNATPSGTSSVAAALLTFAAYTGSMRHREAAEAALGAYGVIAGKAPRFGGWGLAVAEALAAGPVEVAVVGPAEDPRTAALHRAALMHPSPRAAVVVGAPDLGSGGAGTDARVPLLTGRSTLDGAPAAYVCRGFVCDRPTTGVDELRAQMARR